MIGANKFRELISYIPGLLILSLGIYLAIKQPQATYIINQIHGYVELKEGKVGYGVWKNLDIFFRVWIYHVTNPDEVIQGGFPMFEERGPYVYNMNLKKNIINVDEDVDEIAFTTFRTYRFNQSESGSNTGDEEIVMLNSAYYGTILTNFVITVASKIFSAQDLKTRVSEVQNAFFKNLIRPFFTEIQPITERFPMFIDKFGNSIQKLFPNADDIFIRAKAKDILFDGLPLVCDKEANKELLLICSGLRGKKPPIIKDTDKLDHYTYSLFQRNNMTDDGPFTVNRGVKNKDALGNITSHKGKRILKYWSEPACNVVSGTDSITWPPMKEKMPFVSVYEPNLCRTARAYYKREEIIHGLMGYRYELDESTWLDKNMDCYCPINSKKIKQCLITGLMDITKCQEAPAIFSEPHFLHGDKSLLEFAQGLKPNPHVHSTYITLNPLSGVPLSGSRKMQLNMQLKPIPAIKLLSNVSEGFFPMLWAEEANTATVKQLSPIIMAHRLLRVFKYFSWLIIVLGIFFTVKIWWIRGGNNNQTIAEASVIQTQRVTIHPVQRLIHRKPDNHRKRAFM
ncbi:hypothetical protein PV328_008761 [Microctonus aethiopoides]|uniref:Sensory neuron membrane protein 1 n=1 Tax=Microctonus aethiopoides TaxID=144406 RepID=A0AA39FK39_9HYME|nr:hypothetical protein PV328_008761 [Microctonus aethiopoides]